MILFHCIMRNKNIIKTKCNVNFFVIFKISDLFFVVAPDTGFEPVAK